jgi:hypothetical protein
MSEDETVHQHRLPKLYDNSIPLYGNALTQLCTMASLTPQSTCSKSVLNRC